MTAPTPTRIPKTSSAAYQSAKLIYDTGSKTEAELFDAIDFRNQRNLRLSVDHAIETGWLRRLPDERLALTDFTLDFFDTEPVKFVGKAAEPRIVNVMDRKPYSTPKRFVRDDVPAWSVRAGASFFTKV